MFKHSLYCIVNYSIKNEKINLISKLQINSSGQKISLEFINDKLNFIANIDNLKEQLVVTLKAKELDIENIKNH